MKPILTIIGVANFPAGWEDGIGAFHGVSVRSDGLLKFTKAVKVTNLQGWAWVRARSVEEARQEAKRHAALCATYKLTRWYVNCEAEWAGVESYPRTPSPYQCLRIYALTWRIYAPAECQLAYNGFSWGATSDRRKLHDAELIRAFDVWAPMIYGTDRGAIKKTFPNKLLKYPGVTPYICPMLGVGRKDKDGTTWGFWDVHEEMLRQHNVDEFAWFFGNGASGQYYDGHRDHPALVTLARNMHEGEDLPVV